MNLYNHQKEIIEADPKKTGLFLGTGSGKTRIALMLARGRTLVIAPKTQVEDKNWEREYIKVQKHGIITLQLDLLYPKEITVISKETFRRDHAKLTKFDTVIVDEAHTVLGVTPSIRWRNKKPTPKASQLFEALDDYLARIKPERLYLCTATIIRSPMTVWAAAKLLGRDWDFYKWRQTFYFQLPMPGREVWTPKTDEETKERLGSAVRKLGYVGRIEDFIDMPEQIFRKEYTELNTPQKNRIKLLPLDYPDQLVLSGKVHCVENGILNGDEFNQREEFPNEKIDKILDYSIEFPKLLIFAKYIAQIEDISTALRMQKKKVFILTGDTKDRGNLIKEANESKECVFIAQSSISSGWELPTFPCVIFASLDWSVVNYVQAIGRINRINNPKRNLYIHLVARGGFDEKVYKSVVENKMDFHLSMFV